MNWPDVTLLPLHGASPDIARAGLVAAGSRLIGAVTLGEDTSIWYNCVLRADLNSITIGKRSNVQDGSVIHITSRTHATEIGDDVLIGHLAMVHGCKLHDRAFVGLGAIVMDGCEVESDGMLAAGAMLTPGKRIAAGQMWVGRPAKFVRDLSEAEIAGNRRGVAEYVINARNHAAALKGLARTA